MSRSVNYLRNAIYVNYFPVPSYQDEETNEEIFENHEFIVEDIQQTIISNFPKFDTSKKWDNNETKILLEGYGTIIGISEYCGLYSLSIAIDEDDLKYEEDFELAVENTEKWIHDNWNEISKYWNQFRKIGSFSNGESVYEKTN